MENGSKPHAELPKRPERKVGAGKSPFCITSDQLLGEARELLIMHAGRQYRLRLTQNGKLILTA
jgi:hemin uptake protein HemP